MPEPIAVKVVDGQENGCTFCTRRNLPSVYEFRGTDPNRNWVARICTSCWSSLRYQIQALEHE